MNTPHRESVLSRAARILEAFSQDEPALTVSDIARRTGLHVATASRFVAELVAHGFLSRDGDRRVRIGVRLWELVTRASPTLSLRDAAMPFIEGVHDVVGHHGGIVITPLLPMIDAAELMHADLDVAVRRPQQGLDGVQRPAVRGVRGPRAQMTLTDGTELSPALGIGAFAEKTLVAAGQCTGIDPAASPAAAGLLGCGVMAGIGAAVNTGGVGRGDTVAVIGCGGVGDAAVAGARLAGAAKIIAVDIDDRKLATALAMGATHAVNSRENDPVTAIRDLTGGFGADVVIDAVGRPETYQQAFYARDLAGTVVLVGVPTPDMRLELPLQDVFGRGGALKSSWYGDCLPSRDFPLLVDLYLQGRLDLDAFVSETILLDEVEDAFARMRKGEVLRSVVVLG
ncbi:zinc-binding dehydrogenase [Streptomyces sp. NPDC005907]|uniref:zinc-binding dehydrogenase n=1 Tax=Streptomyces sp. NPDC005907 TaxID=3154571 RepID=UPI0033D66601